MSRGRCQDQARIVECWDAGYDKRKKIYSRKNVVSTFYDDARQTSIFCFCPRKFATRTIKLKISGHQLRWPRPLPEKPSSYPQLCWWSLIGGSAGTGLACAKTLFAEGANVVIAAHEGVEEAADSIQQAMSTKVKAGIIDVKRDLSISGQAKEIVNKA